MCVRERRDILREFDLLPVLDKSVRLTLEFDPTCHRCADQLLEADIPLAKRFETLFDCLNYYA